VDQFQTGEWISFRAALSYIHVAELEIKPNEVANRHTQAEVCPQPPERIREGDRVGQSSGVDQNRGLAEYADIRLNARDR
jgi:hypothetical protein